MSAAAVAQDNILDVRENYNIGQTVTVTGVVTSDDNLGSVRYLQDATAGIVIYPGATGAIGTRRLKSETASVSPVKSPSTMASSKSVPS